MKPNYGLQILPAGIIDHSLTLVRALLEHGYYLRPEKPPVQ